MIPAVAMALLVGGPAFAQNATQTAASPTSAVAALDRANAAYDWGDMNQVVDATRAIVDGAVIATSAERAQALRLLGVGLYLTSRPGGAETAFVELLKLRPKSKLDTTATRPEVVVFFEDVKRRHFAEIAHIQRAQRSRSMVWNFLPPVGQFQNSDKGRAWVILGLEVASLGTLVATRIMLESGELSGKQQENPSRARTLKTLNNISAGVLGATWLLGAIDAIIRSDRDPDDTESNLSLVITPLGAGVTGRF